MGHIDEKSSAVEPARCNRGRGDLWYGNQMKRFVG